MIKSRFVVCSAAMLLAAACGLSGSAKATTITVDSSPTFLLVPLNTSGTWMVTATASDLPNPASEPVWTLPTYSDLTISNVSLGCSDSFTCSFDATFPGSSNPQDIGFIFPGTISLTFCTSASILVCGLPGTSETDSTQFSLDVDIIQSTPTPLPAALPLFAISSAA
jgi:hypothetical protein